MRIISLNTWGGRAGKEKLLDFFKQHAGTTDIFCLQEVWSEAHNDFGGKKAGGVVLDYSKIMERGVSDISQALPGFTPIFSPLIKNNYGLFLLVREQLVISTEGAQFVYKEKGYVSSDDVGDHARSIQWVTIEQDKKTLTIINFHGLWNGKDKLDSEDRIQQSKNILAVLEKLKGEIILCGDFNLLPDTESIALLENAGLRNLIREHGITSTRTSFYTRPEKYADYAFVSPGLKVKSFKVLSEEVSDHAALLIEVE